MVEIRRSTLIEAPIESVWAILRDFNGHERWHPAVAASVIEDGAAGDQIGAVRNFRLADGVAHPRAIAGVCRTSSRAFPIASSKRRSRCATMSPTFGSGASRMTIPAFGNGAPPSIRRPPKKRS